MSVIPPDIVISPGERCEDYDMASNVYMYIKPAPELISISRVIYENVITHYKVILAITSSGIQSH